MAFLDDYLDSIGIQGNGNSNRPYIGPDGTWYNADGSPVPDSGPGGLTGRPPGPGPLYAPIDPLGYEPGGFTGQPQVDQILAQRAQPQQPAQHSMREAFQYQPMAGWDQGKLQNGPNNTKYNFGRFIQQQGYDPRAARNNLGDIVNAYNQAFGGRARAIGDDKIDFGESYGPVDVLNSGNYWQWGAWSDPNAPQAQQPSTLASLTGTATGDPKTMLAPTWNAMLQNGSAYGSSPFGQPQEKKPAWQSLASLMKGWT